MITFLHKDQPQNEVVLSLYLSINKINKKIKSLPSWIVITFCTKTNPKTTLYWAQSTETSCVPSRGTDTNTATIFLLIFPKVKSLTWENGKVVSFHLPLKKDVSHCFPPAHNNMTSCFLSLHPTTKFLKKKYMSLLCIEEVRALEVCPKNFSFRLMFLQHPSIPCCCWIFFLS